MAVRTISTKLAVEGEAEYKKSIAACNSELSTMKSNLKLVESEFKGQANSLAALTAKGEALSTMYDKQKEKVATLEAALSNAQAAQDKYTERVGTAKENIERCEKALEELKNSTGDTSEEQAELTKELDKWNSELSEAEAGQAAAARGVNNWQKQLNNAKIDLNNLNGEIKENNKYLEEAEKSADGAATSIDEYGEKTKKAKTAIDTLASALAAAGVAATIKEIAEALTSCVNASIEFESAITGVYKTVNGTDEQLQAISDSIKQMALEIPASTTEIAAVAEAAGQLGIKTEDITSFTKTMVNLGVATNMTADEAATMLAQFANITGMDASKYEAIGSTIVALGNNFATTERKIVEMAQGMASAASIAGLSETDIMALSAAVSSLGIESQAGSSAVSKLIGQLQTAVETGNGLEEFAQVAGMTADEFKTSWGVSAVGAINSFIQGLNETDRTGASAIVTLEKMGITEVRLKNTILSLANSGDLLTNAVNLSSSAWEGNNALSDEASKRYATVESQLQLCENAANNLKAAIGDALSPALEKLAGAGQDGFQWAADFVEANPWVVKAMTALTTGLAVLSVGVIATASAAKIAAAATAIWNAVLLANPVGLVVAGVVALIAAIATLALTIGGADKETREFTKSLEESKKARDELIESVETEAKSTSALASALKTALEAEEKTAAQKAAILDMVEKLNEAVPELGLQYDAMSDSINMTTESLDALVEHAAAQEEYEAQVAALSELYVEQAEIAARLEEAQEAYNEAIETGAGGTRTLQNNINELTEAQAENAEQIAALEEASRVYGEQQALSAAATSEMQTTVNGLVSEMQALQQAYMDAQAKAYDSINSQIGLFDTLDGSAKTSIDNLIQTLTGQVEYMNTYAENINKAMELGVDQGLVQKLSDGSEESAQILAAIVEGGAEEIANLNAEFAKVEEGKQNFSTTVAEMETDFSNKMSDIEARLEKAVEELDVSIEAGAAGVATIQGYIDGAESMRSTLTATYRSLAQAANAAYKAALDIKSPSRVFWEDGRNTIRGAIGGAEEERPRLEQTYEAAARAAIEAFERSLPASNVEPSATARQDAQTAAIVKAISSKSKMGGDIIVNNYSPEALDEKTSAREFKKAQRDLSLGVS